MKWRRDSMGQYVNEWFVIKKYCRDNWEIGYALTLREAKVKAEAYFQTAKL